MNIQQVPEHEVGRWAERLIRYRTTNIKFGAVAYYLIPVYEHLIRLGYIEYLDEDCWQFTELGKQVNKFYNL
jgi:hypothetical protein